MTNERVSPSCIAGYRNHSWNLQGVCQRCGKVWTEMKSRYFTQVTKRVVARRRSGRRKLYDTTKDPYILGVQARESIRLGRAASVGNPFAPRLEAHGLWQLGYEEG